MRNLSQSLNKELFDLVNDNYHDFLSLGSILQGGEDKVEEVRVGLLSFQRDLVAVKEELDCRRKDVANLLDEKRALRQEIRIGRNLLEIADLIEDLEEQLMIGQIGRITPSAIVEEDDSNAEDESLGVHTIDSGDAASDGDEHNSSPRRLETRVEQFLMIKLLLDRCGATHPFLARQEKRISQIRTTLLLDLGGMLKEECMQDDTDHDHRTRLESLLRLYKALGARTDADLVLGQSKKWQGET